MGQGFGEVSAEAKEFLQNCKRRQQRHVWILMVVYTAQELSAMTLQKMKNC
jgi:hypothetical protein